MSRSVIICDINFRVFSSLLDVSVRKTEVDAKTESER